jgi:hypothetical protein
MTAAAGAPPITEANVLGRSDEILSWDRAKEQEKDARFVQLGEYLCEVRAKQYWGETEFVRRVLAIYFRLYKSQLPVVERALEVQRAPRFAGWT